MAARKKTTKRKGVPASRSHASPRVKTSSETTATATPAGLRVRMYRVGFGDFFLVTVPTAAGPKHILIDCGVHAGNIGSLPDAVKQMATDTGHQLALIIMTHRHADHISGFATCKDVFSQFAVEKVWMSWFEDPKNDDAVRFQSNLMGIAAHLQTQLAARTDPEAEDLLRLARNATGEPLAAGRGSSNAVALQVLHGGFKAPQPVVEYYQAGETPTLPASLQAAGITAQILGPPIDPELVAQMDSKNHQYLANVGQQGSGPVVPFPPEFRTDATCYPKAAFDRYSARDTEQMLRSVMPDRLAAKARQADNTLNNQSLVVLFTFRGKNLLFVGDAQWGNWENFLFGGPIGAGSSADLTAKSKSILGSLDFYKVGHHGSTNATPIDTVNAMRDGCVAMCSTEPGQYGSTDRGTEVPRLPLVDALAKKTRNQLVRSDQIPAAGKPPTVGLPKPSSVFTVPPGGQLYVDYDF
jgi:beta-lactamase superfamily II metal-dependent hydrolase